MTKIKFKTEYKPLPDEVINRHKSFDALMAAYVITPKLNFFQKLLKNKWTMFSGGIIIGTVTTLLVTMYNSGSTGNIQAKADDQIKEITSNNPISEYATAEKKDHEKLSGEETTIENNGVANKLYSDQKGNSKILIDDKKNADRNESNNSGINNVGKSNLIASNSDIDPTLEDKNHAYDELNSEFTNNNVDEKTEQQITDDTRIAGESGHIANTISNPNALDFTVDPTPAVDTTKKENLLFQETITTAEPDRTTSKNEIILQEEMMAQETNKKGGIVENEPIIKTEEIKDKTKEKEITFLDKIFEKNIFNKDTIVGLSKNNSDNSISNAIVDSSDFVDRYAQLSFFTPLGTNGLDSYKFKHHFSVNIIQGYNGAVQGLEVGGVANLDKGYMQGAQFAGVTNMVAGNVLGMQGAGVFNAGKSLTGGQFAGVSNLSTGKVRGMQAAGVINLSSSIKEETIIFQAAGVANISLSNNATGFQTAGVLNLANNIEGAQIGLVNVAKKVTGTQIGLVNIADTIEGVSIGLLSFSRNGIFDVDVFTSDILQTNIGLRVGSKYVYNIFAFGVSPFSDSFRYGYGLGIGGHIPVYQDLSIDVDAMAWNTFEDNFDFSYNQFHMINQLRVTPSYSFANNKISVYAGPVLNVEVYEDSVIPLKENTIREFGGNGFTTALSLGYVIGIRFF